FFGHRRFGGRQRRLDCLLLRHRIGVRLFGFGDGVVGFFERPVGLLQGLGGGELVVVGLLGGSGRIGGGLHCIGGRFGKGRVVFLVIGGFLRRFECSLGGLGLLGHFRCHFLGGGLGVGGLLLRFGPLRHDFFRRRDRVH